MVKLSINGVNDNQVWFTSDHHFGHHNIIKHTNRPYVSVDQMNDDLVNKWNEKIAKEDVVIHLGDFSFRSKVSANFYLDRLNFSRMYFAYGNHDKQPLNGKINHFECAMLIINDYEIWVSHYPHVSWPKSFHGVPHLFGHCHGSFKPENLSYDVGVDNNQYYPISLVTIKDMMELKRNKNGR